MAAPKKDLRETVKGQSRLLEKIELFVPGFSGYKEKEIRRAADRLLREALAGELKGVNEAVESAFENITESKMTEAYDAMNTATALMDKIIGKVETADYGYASFFGAIKIREDALDAMYEFDKRLFEDVEAIGRDAEKLVAATDKDDKPAVARIAKDLKRAINDFDKKFDQRKAVLLKLE